jgi:hypothetical protein
VRTTQIVDELIDANESAVALEMLSEMLIELQEPIEGDVIAEVGALVRDMNPTDESGRSDPSASG